MNLIENPHAFPRPYSDNFDRHGYKEKNLAQEGATLLDYFAARAPLDIPSCYEHKPPERNYPDRPTWQDWFKGNPLVTEEDRNILRAYVSDGCFDLPPHLTGFAKDLETYRANTVAWDCSNKKARFFQWRWFYAMEMLCLRAKLAQHRREDAP